MERSLSGVVGGLIQYGTHLERAPSMNVHWRFHFIFEHSYTHSCFEQILHRNIEFSPVQRADQLLIHTVFEVLHIMHYINLRLTYAYLQRRNGWRRGVLVSALASVNVVIRHWARLLLGWVTARGQVTRWVYITSYLDLGRLSLLPSVG